jgi:YidC/Oxa1 family membrane protein insertase
MPDQKNLILAIALSILIIVAFQVLYEAPRMEARQEALQQQRAEEAATLPSLPQLAPSGASPVLRDRGEVLREGTRVRIDTPALHGSLSTVGFAIDDLTLARYRIEPDPRSPEVVLLSPIGSTQAYYGEFGWIPTPANPGVAVPDAATRWTAPQLQNLRPGNPITMQWDNGQGLIFEKTVSVDEDYMFTVTQRVVNLGAVPVELVPYGLVSRHGAPPTLGYYILHEGPIGWMGDQLRELSYDSLQEEPDRRYESTGGWVGITDKYWLVAVAAGPEDRVVGRFRHVERAGQDRYQADITFQPVTVQPGQNVEHVQRMFAGAKRFDLLSAYAERFGITNLDLAIDFGWFWFLTRPFSQALTFLGQTFGNFGVAILILTLLVKAAFFPLANKAYTSMSKMKALQPKMQQLQERYKDNKEQLQREMMALYKAEKVNPVSGCLPILLQIPVFFALYKVLFVTIEMRHAPFFGWIRDLSAPEPTTIFNLFGLLPFDPPTFLMHIGIWPILMGITMYFQQKMNPAPPDPMQQRIFAILPFLFTFMLAAFPVGLVIYWAWNNLLSIAQQYVIMRRMGVKPT